MPCRSQAGSTQPNTSCSQPTSSGARLALLLHHDDAEREAAYDREFRLSPLSEALDKAEAYGLTVVSMKRYWKIVF